MRASRLMSWCDGWWRMPRSTADDADGDNARAEAGMTADAPPRPHGYASRRLQRGREAWSRGYDRVLQRCAVTVARIRVPNGAGTAASMALVIGALGYGVIQGGH